MAKVLNCPACGAPLSLDDDDRDGVVECFYCKRHVVIQSGALTQAPARKVVASPGAPVPPPPVHVPKQPSKDASKSLQVKMAVVFCVGGLAWALYPLLGKVLQSSKEEERPKVEAGLNKLDLSSNQQRVAELFGVKPGSDSIANRTTIDAMGPGLVRRAELSWTEADKSVISDVNVFYQPGVSKDAANKKLATLVANRARAQGNGIRVSQGDAVLDLNEHGLHVWHWGSVHPQNAEFSSCMQRIKAMWAVGRAAALDGPAPTPAELKLVNGPTLEEAADVDTAVTVEQAVDFFQKKHPSAWCRMQAGLMCVVDVDDELVDNVRYLWPNGLKARVGQARLEFVMERATEKALRSVAACLEPALGKGEETVVDYVRGTRTWKWKLADSGDQAALEGRTLVVSTAEGKALDQPAAWHGKLAKILSAVASCSP